jgi:hypothetical protein
MATGRTVQKFERFYVNGYDVSGYARSVGPYVWTFNEVDESGMIDGIKGFLPGMGQASPGTLSAAFDNSTGVGIHTVGSALDGTLATVLAPVGIRAAPSTGDPAFMGQYLCKGYTSAMDAAGGVIISMPFAGWETAASSLLYCNPWGILVHPWGQETSTNAAVGVLCNGSTAVTTHGGYAVFHMSASTAGGVTLKVQHSTDNSTFTDLITSATMDASSTPQHSLVALAPTATVNPYIRWTIGATATVTFSIGFVRGWY